MDKIIELTDTVIVGIKNVSFNEWFFPGHFPSNPVMPGVLQIEALAQTGIKEIASAAAFLQSVTDAASKRIDAGNAAEPEIQNAVSFAIAGLRALAL